MVHKPFFKGYHPRFYFRTEDDQGVIQVIDDIELEKQRVQEMNAVIKNMLYPMLHFVPYSENVRPINSYLEEIRALKNQLARANSEWTKERELRRAALEREMLEKKRADDAEAKLKQIRGVLCED